ncbi:spore germination protein [Caldalkalibacillus salinus]|uniref:spore germination protein n=1 Tax=Caldalkalibacillus salinus TaxID=2803787 RepID=UPI0019237701|nr:spore germination protein [Caldalkalibacillus salinus]
MSRQPRHIGTTLDQNIIGLREAFSSPTNQDLIERKIRVPHKGKTFVVIYIRGLINENVIDDKVIKPLSTDQKLQDGLWGEESIEATPTILEYTSHDTLEEVIHRLLQGHTIILFEGKNKAYAVPTVGFKHRSVTEPEMEIVIKGPRESFVESREMNGSLIRKQLKHSHLVTDTMRLGQTQSEVSLMYIDGLVRPGLLKEVREKIKDIPAEHVQNLSMLEQYIEDKPYSLVPTVLYTERPDRAASFLQEGHVVLLMDSSPVCLVVPVTFWSFFHTAEDQYQRWAFGNQMRIIRLIAFFAALFLPAMFVAVLNYHVEMVPTDLLLTMGGTRENVPFPVLFEVLLVEVTFDIIREAGIRMPTKMGIVVTLIGALIISLAAIEAGMVSPIVIVVVGFASLASFTIPSNSFNFAVRIARFGFIALAGFMGLLGMALGITVCVAYLVSTQSFGVPFVSPMAPHYRSSKDLILRPPVWKQWLRPFNIHPQDPVRHQKGGSRR